MSKNCLWYVNKFESTYYVPIGLSLWNKRLLLNWTFRSAQLTTFRFSSANGLSTQRFIFDKNFSKDMVWAMQSNHFLSIITPWGLDLAPWSGEMQELPREEAGQGLTTRSRPTTPAQEQDMPESSSLHGAGVWTRTNVVQNPQNLYSVARVSL